MKYDIDYVQVPRHKKLLKRRISSSFSNKNVDGKRQK